MRHHGFLAVALAGTVAAAGWILSRSDVVDASEEHSAPYREAYAQSDREIKAAEDPDGLRLNYFDARWSRVLRDVSKHAELTLVMDKIPPGRFARRDRTRYSADDCIRILNRELEGLGYRLLRQDQFLVVLHLDQARTRYARPVLPADNPVRATSRSGSVPVRTASARVDQSTAHWASDTLDSGDEGATNSGSPQTPATVPVRASAFQETLDSADKTAELEAASVKSVIRRLEIEHSTAAEVARAVYLVFERRAELVQKGLQDLPTFVVYGTDDTDKTGVPLFRVGIDQQNQSLIVEASQERTEQLLKLLTRLDKPASDKSSTRLVPAENISDETAKNLDRKLRQLVATRLQQSGEQAADDPVVPEAADTDAFSLRGDVNVQAMPGTGVLLIEGNEEDLERLAPIIQRLEELSIGSLPDIHLLDLNHVNSESFAALLTSVYDRLAELRKRGDAPEQSVAFYPVVQPNSVLILAPQLELPSILQLAEKLDTELDPESEFRVFPLKHAIASQVHAALESFYEDPPGLATRIRAVPDVRTNSVIVQGHPRDLTEVKRLVDELDRDQPGSVHRMAVIELKHATAEELAEVLNSAIQAVTSPPQTTGGNSGFGGSQGPQELRDTKSIALEFLSRSGTAQHLIRSGFLVDVRISPDPRSNSLILSAPEASLTLLEALVATLDQAPSATAAIKVFELKNADAEQTVELLISMFENVNQEEQLGVQIQGAEDAASSLIPLQFSADIRTNTVLAVGSEESLDIVAAILLRLDSDEARRRTTTVIQLRNAPAEDVSESINLFLEQQQSLQDSSEDLISNIERVRQEVIVAPDLNSNSLIVSASPDYFSQITQMIHELDATPPQVIIQALLVEVQLNNTDEFGVELGFQDPLLFQRSIVETLDDLITIPTTTNIPGVGLVESTTIVTQNNTPGFNFNNTAAPLGNNAVGNTRAVGAQGISGFSLGRQNGDLGFGGFVFSAQSDAVNVLIRALAARRTLQVLSRPQIRTTHNSIATIRVGQEVPVVNGVVIDQGVVSPEIEQRDTGIILRVTPRITPDGTIAMTVYAEKSRLSDGGVPVFTDINTGNVIESQIRDVAIAETTVNIPNGQTIVIGGIITKSDETLERKVPWLGDLPVVGKAFRYDATDTVRSELLMFLTPRIIYGPADSELIKQVETERMHFLESDAEEIHGPLYAVPPARAQGFEGFEPTPEPYVPADPTPESDFHTGAGQTTVPADEARARDRLTVQSAGRRSDSDQQEIIQTGARQSVQSSSRIESARFENTDGRQSWMKRLLRKNTDPSAVPARAKPTESRETGESSGPSQPELDFGDAEWK